jgi:hypothetical protein
VAIDKTYKKLSDWPGKQANSGKLSDANPGWKVAGPGSLGDPINSSGERAECLNNTSQEMLSGSEEQWVRFVFTYPDNMQYGSDWCITPGQLHLSKGGTQPIIVLAISGGKQQIKWSSGGGHSVLWERSIVKNKKTEYIVHYKCGQSAPIEAWVDGVAVATKTGKVGDGSGNIYWKSGIYTGGGSVGPVTVHEFQMSKTKIAPGGGDLPPPAEDTTGPVVTCPIPEGAALEPGMPDGWTCEASDPESGVTKVEFYVDQVLVLTETSPPYGDSKAPDGKPWTTACEPLLVPGGHVLGNKAYNGAGLNHTVERPITIMGDTPDPPDPPDPDSIDITGAVNDIRDAQESLDEALVKLSPPSSAE